MKYERTPDARFANLINYPFAPNYVQIADTEGGELRMHYLDEGPADGSVILLLHGQPAWSYLYRKMIPILVDNGYRIIAPDLMGFGKSDKPTKRENYTYANHVGWVKELLEALNLTDITFFGQDWGGLIGLRLVAENPHRFARVVISNTDLPDVSRISDAAQTTISSHAYYDSLPVHKNPKELFTAMMADTTGLNFLQWVKFASESDGFSPRSVFAAMGAGLLSEDDLTAYDAPFPDEGHLQGARQFPSLVPMIPDNPAKAANQAAWEIFEQWEKPFLTAFSDSDPITAGRHVRFQKKIPGAQGQPHITVRGGHFIQEEAFEELCAAIMQLIAMDPS